MPFCYTFELCRILRRDHAVYTKSRKRTKKLTLSKYHILQLEKVIWLFDADSTRSGAPSVLFLFKKSHVAVMESGGGSTPLLAKPSDPSNTQSRVGRSPDLLYLRGLGSSISWKEMWHASGDVGMILHSQQRGLTKTD